MKMTRKENGSKIPELAWIVLAAALPWLPGCSGRQAVYAMTGTTIGVEVAQNPATQLYQAKLGYNRAELAIVPSNRSAGEEAGCVGGGAPETGEVIMELKYTGMFSTNAGIYQRLAVGQTAVQQPGAAFLFARNASGQLDAQTADKIQQAFRSFSSVSTAPPGARELADRIVKIYNENPDKRPRILQVLRENGYSSWNHFTDENPAYEVEKLQSILEKIQ